MVERALVDRLRAAARGRVDRGAMLFGRGRPHAPGRRDLPARGLRLDARGKSVAVVDGMEARVGFPVRAVGPLLRADDSLPAGDRLSDTPDSRGVLACV